MNPHLLCAMLVAIVAICINGCSPPQPRPDPGIAAVDPLVTVAVLPPLSVPPRSEPVIPPPRIAIALGGGAASGFAHVGVIKILETQGIRPDIVIAVDISRDPQWAAVSDSVSVLLQTFNIMGRSLAAHELASADVVISPDIRKIGSTSFESRNLAILEGE